MVEIPDASIQQFRDNAQKIYEELLFILVRKQIDYGPYNVLNAPGGPINGLLVRISDKIERLKNLIYNPKTADPQFESIEDSFVDLANYAIIALMVQRNIWNAHVKENI